MKPCVVIVAMFQSLILSQPSVYFLRNAPLMGFFYYYYLQFIISVSVVLFHVLLISWLTTHAG